MAKKQIVNIGDDKQYLTGAFPVEPGSKGALVSHMMQSIEISKNTDQTDVSSMIHALENYIALCASSNVNLTLAGVCGAIGISRDTLKQWSSGKGRGADPRFKEFALMVKRICGQYLEIAAAEGQISVPLAIWWQKNYDGLKDLPDVEKAVTVVDRPADPETIAEKYRHAITDDSGARMEAERERRSVDLAPIYEEDEDEDDNS